MLANAGVMDEFRERARRTEQLAGRKEEEAGEVDQLRDTLAEKKARRPEPPFINRFFFCGSLVALRLGLQSLRSGWAESLTVRKEVHGSEPARFSPVAPVFYTGAVLAKRIPRPRAVFLWGRRARRARRCGRGRAQGRWLPELQRIVGVISADFARNMRTLHCAGEVGRARLCSGHKSVPPLLRRPCCAARAPLRRARVCMLTRRRRGPGRRVPAAPCGLARCGCGRRVARGPRARRQPRTASCMGRCVKT